MVEQVSELFLSIFRVLAEFFLSFELFLSFGRVFVEFWGRN